MTFPKTYNSAVSTSHLFIFVTSPIVLTLVQRDGSEKLLKGFSREFLQKVEEHLKSRPIASWGTLTTDEAKIVDNHDIVKLFNLTMSMWVQVLIQQLGDEPNEYELACKRTYLTTALDHLEVFKAAYEEQHGMTEDANVDDENTVHIPCPRVGFELVLQTMMTRRLQIIFKSRNALKRRQYFMQVEYSQLHDADRDCFICLVDKQGNEASLKLTECCGQVIGQKCLTEWINAMVQNEQWPSCPMCRHRFSLTFGGLLLEAAGQYIISPE